MRRAPTPLTLVLAATAACSGPAPPEVEATTGGSTGGGSTTRGSSSGAPPPGTSTDAGPPVTTGSSTADDVGLDSSSTAGVVATTTEGSSGTTDEGTTGEPSPVGCADGSREALEDEVAYPGIAACAGGFWVPGVGAPVPACNREGGNDGPHPDGIGCSIADLCAAGWHLCTTRYEVAMAGLASCGNVSWGGQFFATAQSGEGANACNDTGTNDVFGCGDVGYENVSGCAPLDRSTGNLCVSLPGAWECSEDAYDEVSYLVKPGPDFGGALCCLDGP